MNESDPRKLGGGIDAQDPTGGPPAYGGAGPYGAMNPYAPPAHDAAWGAPPDDESFMDASKGARFANLVIDSVVRTVIAGMCGAVLGLLGMADVLEGAGSFVFGLALQLVYYIGCEATFGRTVGKLVTGTMVVDESGRAPRFTQIVGRTFSRYVPFEAFSFLGDDRGWHDRWSKTRVVKVR